ncbi:hypothetical protein [Tenacibaculum finnmarkense]|uniref:hypothetical protein n=1 Tax=Tenacibaculum finnmarkense TaxID=2781243 RepID=UPI001EFBFB40|nr:hypothetical protein [Tenacibaculum finnmarkense]MCG8734112.1 hypothetical protein [Tenacibaculum finnmarkense]MCG8803657.1 hypothetical protein [Tenacibaculum finnmarkense]MCG8826472.1 hypothetical protein [Tenacibaculum finnmarkense]
MKNKILSLLIILIIFSCKENSTQEKLLKKENDLSEYNLKNNVKYFLAIKYIAKDSFGIVLKNGIYKDKYDNLSEYEESISFNKEGFVLNKIEFNDGKIKSKEVFIRDSLNRKSQLKHFNSKNEFTRKDIFKYNENGKINEMSGYNNNGNIIGKWIFVYEKDKMTRIGYDSKGSMGSKHISSFNKLGELDELKYLDFDNSKLNYTDKFRYDKEQNTKTEFSTPHYSSGLDDTKWITKYNEKGDLIERILNDTYVTKFQYEYDKSNNWIKQIEYSEGFPRYIIERKINYYN